MTRNRQKNGGLTNKQEYAQVGGAHGDKAHFITAVDSKKVFFKCTYINIVTRNQIKGTRWIWLLLRLKNFILVNRNLG